MENLILKESNFEHFPCVLLFDIKIPPIEVMLDNKLGFLFQIIQKDMVSTAILGISKRF